MGSIDDDQFRRLVHEHSPAIGNYLRRRLYPLTSSDLDDLVEETLIVVWKKRSEIPAEAELAWMIGVARNVLRNARRARQRKSSHESSLKVGPNDSSAEDYVVADVTVREALARLTDDDREILMLSAWDGLDVHAIAATLSVTTNVAAVRLTRAQSRFREFFASVEVA
jgi:RNA polymerase sigma-70 factor (ECF subfamily)